MNPKAERGSTALTMEQLVTLLATDALCTQRWPDGRRSRMALTGDGNARKSTVANALARDLPNGTACVLEVDAFAIDRDERLRRSMSGYNPAAFDLAAFARALADLQEGRAVWVPHYDHSCGRSCRCRECDAHEHVVVPGSSLTIAVGVFLWHRLFRGDWDVCVFFAADEDADSARRVARDTRQRGYASAEACAHARMLASDRERFIEPSLRYCDHVARVRGDVFELHPQSAGAVFP